MLLGKTPLELKVKTLHYVISGLFIGLFLQTGYSQLTFQRAFGGVNNDAAEAITAVTTGGFVVAGNSQTYGTLGAGGNFNEDNKDYFVVRGSDAGTTTWSRTSGVINNREEARYVAPTADGGFMVGGRTYDNIYKDDWYIQKFNGAGTGTYNRNFGMLGGFADWDDELFKAQQVTPSGTLGENYGMAGWTMNYRSADNRDMTFAIHEITTNNLVATLHFGTTAGTTLETARDFVQESPTVFSMFGWTDGFAGGAGRNFMLVRMTYTPPVIIPPTPASLAVSSYRSFGGNGADEGTSYVQTSDGGYIMCGFSNSFGAGSNDILLIKTGAAPTYTVQWARAIGGAGDDRGYQVKQLSDGTYIVVGSTNSYGGGSNDMFAVKLDGSGNFSWAKAYGSTGNDEGKSLSLKSDGGFYFAGHCDPPISPAGNGRDMYVVSASPTGYSGGCYETTVTPTVTVIPPASILTANTGGSSSTASINQFAKAHVVNSPSPNLACNCSNYIPNREITGATQVCRNSSGSYYVNTIPGITNYSWSISGGTFASAPGPTDTTVNVNFTNTNVQIIVTANLTPAACNFAIDTINITVDQIATAITTADSLLCVGQSTTLNVNTVNNVGGLTYSWNPALPTPSASEVVTPGTTTTYTVTVTDGLTCTATDTIRVTVFPYPVVNIGPNDTVCNGGPVLLNATTAGATYAWSTSAVTPTINAVTSGTYWVDVTTNGCTTRDSIILGISNGPTINIVGDDSICIGENTILTANPSGGSGPYNYQWASGLGTANNINVSPIITTTYTVTITEAFGCTNSQTQTVSVFTYPVVNIGPNDTVCNGGPVLLNATTASSTYLWNTSATTATINALTSGIYWVDVDRFGCVTRDSIILGISTSPLINITGDDSICIGQNTILTANPSGGTGPYSYLWASGLGTANNINVSPIVNTTYTVTVTESYGCTNTETQLVNVFGYPVVNIGPNDTVCNGGPVLLNATTAGASYVWNTSAVTATINAATSGTYWVDVTTNGCTTRDSIVLGISTNPVVNITGDDSLCIGDIEVLTANPSGGSGTYSYSWALGLGNAQTANISPVSSTTFTVTVTEGYGCTNTATYFVNVFNYPVVTLGPDSGICDGVVPFVTLDAQNAGANYTWSTASNTQTINVNTSGTYWVDVMINGCTTRDSIDVTFSTTPTAGYLGTTTICNGDATMIYGNGSGGTSPYTYVWSQGPTTADSISLSPTANTNYSVIVSDVGGCSDTAFFSITVNPNPVINLGADSTGCFNSPIDLNAPATTGTILWSTGSSATSITAGTAGIYWLDITELGCSSRDSIVIDYYPIPNVNLGNDTVICSITTLNFDATNIFSTYAWSTGATTPGISVSQSGIYWVDVTSCGVTYSDTISVAMDTFSVYVVSLVPNECGSSNGSLTVNTTSAIGVTYNWTSGTTGNNPALTNISDGTYTVEATNSNGCMQSLTIPVVCTAPTVVITQLITPNGDGKNDTWIIQGINLFPNSVVKVFNRWGNEVYNASPYNNDWDGRSNSGLSVGNGYLPAGSYYYVVDLYGDQSDVRTGYLEFQP